MALRSATECAALLHVCRRLTLLDDKLSSTGRDLLSRVVAMLTKMVVNLGQEPGTGSGSGSDE